MICELMVTQNKLVGIYVCVLGRDSENVKVSDSICNFLRRTYAELQALHLHPVTHSHTFQVRLCMCNPAIFLGSGWGGGGKTYHVNLGGGVWAREIGTICPFGVFPLFYSNFRPNSRPIHVARPIVLFGSENGLFKLPKHYVLKGKWPILKRKIL